MLQGTNLRFYVCKKKSFKHIRQKDFRSMRLYFYVLYHIIRKTALNWKTQPALYFVSYVESFDINKIKYTCCINFPGLWKDRIATRGRGIYSIFFLLFIRFFFFLHIIITIISICRKMKWVILFYFFFFLDYRIVGVSAQYLLTHFLICYCFLLIFLYLFFLFYFINIDKLILL